MFASDVLSIRSSPSRCTHVFEQKWAARPLLHLRPRDLKTTAGMQVVCKIMHSGDTLRVSWVEFSLHPTVSLTCLSCYQDSPTSHAGL
jgi:hypothetical protein